MSTVDERKILASQQYALDSCQDDMNQLDRVKTAWESGFETANETFQYTLEDMEKCFKAAKSTDWYIDFDDEQYTTEKFKTFKAYLKTIKK